MRTDSTFLSDDAVNMVRAHIESQFGEKYLPAKPNRYGNKAGAQEATKQFVRQMFHLQVINLRV